MSDEWKSESTAVILLGACTEAASIDLPEVVINLVELRGDLAGRRCDIEREVIIGRSPEATIQVGDDQVSRRHARIQRLSHREFEIEDLDSRNGTTVNGLPLRKGPLEVGDRIQVGRTVFMLAHHCPLVDLRVEVESLRSIGRLIRGAGARIDDLIVSQRAEIQRLLMLSSEESVDSRPIVGGLSRLEQVVRMMTSATEQLLELVPQEHEPGIPDLADVMDETESTTVLALPCVQQRVLLVESDETARAQTEVALGDLGYRVLVARDGNDAFRSFLEHGEHLDLVVLDLSVPPLGGMDTLRILRRISPDVRAVVTSDGPAQDIALDLAAAGVGELLQKPVSGDALRHAIAMADSQGKR